MTAWERAQPLVLHLGGEPDEAELGDVWDSPDGPMVMGPDGWEPES